MKRLTLFVLLVALAATLFADPGFWSLDYPTVYALADEITADFLQRNPVQDDSIKAGMLAAKGEEADNPFILHGRIYSDILRVYSWNLRSSGLTEEEQELVATIASQNVMMYAQGATTATARLAEEYGG